MPKSFTLVKSVRVEDCVSVAYSDNKAYVGICGKYGALRTVAVLGSTYGIARNFIEFEHESVLCARVYGNKLYIGVIEDGPQSREGRAFRVFIYGLSGKYDSSWKHKFETFSGRVDHPFFQLAVLSDQVVIPDRSHARLIVYSLDGGVIKHIPCPISKGAVAVCTLGTDNVIIVDDDTSSVCNVKVSTSEVVWTSTAVPSPEGVTSYGVEHVCVASSTDKICMLDASTGKYVM